MQTTLYLARHGETDYNRLQIMQGRRINSRLNETGRRQARALARRLSGIGFDAAYTSTLDRAIETLAIGLSGRAGVPVHRLADLDEMSWGDFEGQPYTGELRQSLGDVYAAWDRGDFGVPVAGGESILDVQGRALRAVERIVGAHPGGTVLVVTHGRLLRVLLATVLDGYGLERMNAIQHANTSVNLLVHRDGRFAAELLNCTAHLDTAEDTDEDTAGRTAGRTAEPLFVE